MIKYFFSISLLLIIFIFISAIYIDHKRKENYFIISRLLFWAAITILSCNLCYLIKQKQIVYLAYSFYLFCTDILVFQLIKFFTVYSGSIKFYDRIKKILKIIVLFDFFSLLLNHKFHHIFTVVPTSINNYNLYTMNHSNMYFLHFIIVYSLVFIAFSIISYQLYKSKNFYKYKYISFFLSYLVIIAVNLGTRFTTLSIDYSVIFYGVLALSICYFTYYYVPRVIQRHLKNNIINNLDDVILGYDINNNCLLKNNINKIKEEILNDIEYDINTTYKDSISKNDCFSWTKKINKENKYLEINLIKIKEKNNEIGKYVIIHDKTKEVLKEKEENFLLTHDYLTHIYNIEKFCIVAREILNNNLNESYYMMCSNIRNFKLINEMYGETKGDEILICCADELKKQFKENPKYVYGRMDKDNFIVMIPKKEFKKDFFIKKSRKLNTLIDNKFKIYLNIGIYEIHNPTISIRLMIDHAYEAIRFNRNNYNSNIFYYDDSIRINNKNEQIIVNDFYKALKNNEFKMFLQPQFDLSQKILGAEALVRWIKDGKMIPPNEFIPIFEKYGLINLLDKYIWEQACIQLKKWNNKQYISINISPYDFYFENINKVLENLVKKYKIDKKRLKLEITETALMSDRDNRLKLIDDLKQSGFTVEMDDFGSGYSSLNFLKNINFDVVKLDMGFLMDTNNIEKSKIILENVINLCKKLDMKVIVEGVETKSQFEFLSECGGDVFQGYYFEKPIDIDSYNKKYLEEG